MIDNNEISENEQAEETRTVFGASEDGFEAINYLVEEKKWFVDERTAFRTALAYAVARKLNPSSGVKYKSKWNIGTLEQSGRIELLLIEAGYSKDPYTFVNALGDAGLKELHIKARRGYTLSSILFD